MAATGLRRTLLSTALGTLRYSGVFILFGNSRRRQESLLILCYHGLSLADEHKWKPKLYMTREQFLTSLSTTSVEIEAEKFRFAGVWCQEDSAAS